MDVLIISPHMDDEVLGCGGTIAKHVENGDRLSVCVIANRVYNHQFDERKYEIEQNHSRKAKKVLSYSDLVFFGLKDERLEESVQEIVVLLEKYIEKNKPSVVYIPFSGDNNQDHRATFNASRIALRPLATHYIEKICMYEVPSSTEQSPPLHESAFMPNYYVDITNYFKKKTEAYECYVTEKRDYPHPRSKEALKVLAQKRGIEVGFPYAEAFVLIRQKW